jgi:CubicO group peptidase (beta-lactamase class C family)
LNAFLSGYQLTHDPGTKFEYSSLGAGLLGHVIALKAGSDYESLVVDRICRPLKMDSTRITLTPELKARFATGHNRFGEAVPSWDRQTQLGGSALRSTANDLLKFVSANLGLTPSSLTPVMEKTHVVQLPNAIPETDIGLAWMITRLHGDKNRASWAEKLPVTARSSVSTRSAAAAWCSCLLRGTALTWMS